MAKHSLFRSDIEPRCAYCARGNPLSDDQVACRKYGVVSGAFHCRRFRYDPLRRIPPKPAVMRTDFLPEQFLLLPPPEGREEQPK